MMKQADVVGSGGAVRHLAVIMDGNGRWANARHLPRLEGHRRGAEAARQLIEACVKHQIPHVTLYAFSAENWRRPEEEVRGLMELLGFYLKRETKKLHEQGIRLRFMGERDRLDAGLRQQMEAAEELTAGNQRLCLYVALSYGSRQEMLQAVRQLARQCECGEKQASELTEQDMEMALYQAGVPDPDLLIRTGGEQRISNFLLWQMAYTELYFTPVLWPDFDAAELENALQAFAARERRFGQVLPDAKGQVA